MNNLERFPDWAGFMAEKYRGGTCVEFILYGSVFDLVPIRREGASTGFTALKDFLTLEMFPQRDAIIYYDMSAGITFPHAKMLEDFQTFAAAVDVVTGTRYAGSLPKEPSKALLLIDRYIRGRIGDTETKKKIAVVIDFAQMVVPAGDINFLSPDESSALITLVKWASDPAFMRSDVTVCLIAENLADLNQMLAQNPYVTKVQVSLPEEKERLEFVRRIIENTQFAALSDVTPEALAVNTAGLSRVNTQTMVNVALKNEKRITMDYIADKKKELIEKECFGLLEFMKPTLTLDMVCGHEAAKKWLRDDARLLKEGKLDALPMGYLICGPIGTGKTFLIKCYAGTIGIPCVVLMNFRSKWQGVTEGNWEKILTVLRATGPVGVIIDEADAALGDRDTEGDSGTQSRVFAQLAGQMSDTRYRGRILWFLLTCRPDLLPVDLKRQGRAEVHVPLFHPDDAGEKRALVKAMAKKVGASINQREISKLPLDAKLSGADIEGILVRARRRSLLAGAKTVENEHIEAEMADFQPPNYKDAIELQELVAVAECTSKDFLPERYRTMEPGVVLPRIRQLKAMLGEA
ncbi:MAG: AAA family ATPase [Planctomycetota bacterium]|nr:AAA family ATPase [Planctomycetota bacterium]